MYGNSAVAVGQSKPTSQFHGASMSLALLFRPVRSAICLFACCVITAASAVDTAYAEDARSSKVDHAKVGEAINKAADFLKQAQGNDGSFSASSGPGITAIVGAALMRCGRSPQDPVVAKALKYLEGNVHDDGGIYQKGSNHKNYETCLRSFAFMRPTRIIVTTNCWPKPKSLSKRNSGM